MNLPYMYMKLSLVSLHVTNQALYLLPSLGQGLHLSVVRLEIQTGQDPYDSHSGDRSHPPLMLSLHVCLQGASAGVLL